MSGHKIGAPKGVGAIYVRQGTELTPHIHGGHQEHGLRAGTHNVAGIAAFGKACELAGQHFDSQVATMKRLRDRLEQGIMARVTDVQFNGHPQQRLPNTLNLSFSYVEGEGLLLHLDMKGVAASSGSACTSGSEGHSHVLQAMKVDEVLLNSSIRFSLGVQTTEQEIDTVLEELPPIVEKLREMSPMLGNDLDSVDCMVVECDIDDHH